MLYVYIILIIALVIFIYEKTLSYLRHQRRGEIYELAKKRAKALGKPLIVIGDPHNGLGCTIWGPKYDLGDVMIDLFPCKKCEKNKKTIKADMTEALKKFGSNSAVIYTSCVLEYVPEVEEAIAEIERVAGSHKNIFAVHVQPYCLTAFSYPYPKSIINHDGPSRVFLLAPPEYPKFVYKNFIKQ
jgi:hypothetical protein